MGSAGRRPSFTGTWGWQPPRTASAFDELVNHVDGYLCELKDAQIRGGLHVLGEPPTGQARVDLLLALTRLPQAGVPSLRDAVAARLGAGDAPSRSGLDAIEAECRRLLVGERPPGSTAEAAVLAWVSSRLEPALDRTPDEIGAVLAALDGRWVPPGPSGAPDPGHGPRAADRAQLLLGRPQGPSLPPGLGGRPGPGRPPPRTPRRRGRVATRPTVGLVVWGTAAMRTGGDDVAEALALLGVRPVWQAESGRVTGLELIPLEELGRPRVDVVLRISGFFRDAFPHLIALLDEAIGLAGFGDGDPRIFGAKPGAYGSGILPLLESRDWRSDEDLAAVYLAWGGYSYGRAGMGVPAADGHATPVLRHRHRRQEPGQPRARHLRLRRLPAGPRRHDRHRAGPHRPSRPRPSSGTRADPSRPRVRSLAEEVARVVRTRVLNPKWIMAMTRHGYKGAFELAATVDYLFGYDATARVVEDWMYERVTEAYVADPEIRKFLEASNPWALRAMAERLLEAAERGLWSASPTALETLRGAVLEAEGWEESR